MIFEIIRWDNYLLTCLSLCRKSTQDTPPLQLAIAEIYNRYRVSGVEIDTDYRQTMDSVEMFADSTALLSYFFPSIF